MKTLVLGVVALSLLTGSAAYAQRSDHGPRYETERDRFYRGDRRSDDSRWSGRGVLPYELRRGGHYVHDDWRGSGLRPPPRDHLWFRIGNEFILAHEHTGRIADVENARGRPAVWTRGGVVPYELRRGGRYIHYDWQRAGLRRPPQDHFWFRLGDTFVLAHEHTGRIVDVESPDDDRDRRRGRRR